METARDPLLELLLSEADEIFTSMAGALDAVRARPRDDVALARLIQGAHTLRGLAAIGGHAAIADLAGRLEAALDRQRRLAIAASGETLGLIDESVRALRQLVALAAEGRGDVPPAVAALSGAFERAGAAPEERRPTVLVVDDSRTVLRFVERALSEVGLRVVTARTAAAAAAVISSERPALVLLDLSLGDLDGAALLGQLADDSALAGTRVVLFSSRPDDELLELARRFGAAGVLPKTRAPGELVARVREHLDAPRHGSSAR
ncbi:response regulator [Sorangium sp. So ce1389]|uniref:response regulator n=1 Tax=Sorangium sp. So ce1389 TaxID=3133336 RepID=UPI003F634E6F